MRDFRVKLSSVGEIYEGLTQRPRHGSHHECLHGHAHFKIFLGTTYISAASLLFQFHLCRSHLLCHDFLR